MTVPRTVEVNIKDTVDGQSVTPKSYSIPTSASRYIGPFPPGDYGDVLEVNVDNAELKLTAYHLG